MRRNGAVEEEIAFLLSGRRAELNAMASDRFVEFIEGKLTEHGIAKVVPTKDTLDEAFRLFEREARLPGNAAAEKQPSLL